MTQIRTFHALASPVCHAIMADNEPAQTRLRIMADQLRGKIEAGGWPDQTELRALVFALHDVADKLAEAELPAPMRRSRRGWWWRIFG